MKKVLVIHGPNLNLLGRREQSIYGSATLEQINVDLKKAAETAGASVTTFQSNHEGALVDEIQKTGATHDGIIINPAAYTHTSVALRDALLAVGKPVVEVHLSNIFKREEFRQHSFISDIAVGVVSGLGPEGYRLALEGLLAHLGREAK